MAQMPTLLPAFSTTFKVPYIKVDSKGRVTQAATHTVKLPAAPVNITGNAATATKLATARNHFSYWGCNRL